MANRYFGIDYGSQSYVTNGSSTVSKDVEVKVNLTGMHNDKVIIALEKIKQEIINSQYTNS